MAYIPRNLDRYTTPTFTPSVTSVLESKGPFVAAEGIINTIRNLDYESLMSQARRAAMTKNIAAIKLAGINQQPLNFAFEGYVAKLKVKKKKKKRRGRSI